MKPLELHVDRNLCVGSATCEMLAPMLFKVQADGKSHPIEETSKEHPLLVEAVESCPTGAITARDPSTGEVVHPTF